MAIVLDISGNYTFFPSGDWSEMTISVDELNIPYDYLEFKLCDSIPVILL